MYMRLICWMTFVVCPVLAVTDEAKHICGVPGAPPRQACGDGIPCSPMSTCLLSPRGIAYDSPRDRYYISERIGHRIRTFMGNQRVTTYAGNNTASRSGVQTGVRTRLNSPTYLMVYSARSKLFCADSGNMRIVVFDLPSGVSEIFIGKQTSCDDMNVGRKTACIGTPYQQTAWNGRVIFGDSFLKIKQVSLITNVVTGLVFFRRNVKPFAVAVFRGVGYASSSDVACVYSFNVKSGMFRSFLGNCSSPGDTIGQWPSFMGVSSIVPECQRKLLFFIDPATRKVKLYRFTTQKVELVCGSGADKPFNTDVPQMCQAMNIDTPIDGAVTGTHLLVVTSSVGIIRSELSTQEAFICNDQTTTKTNLDRSLSLETPHHFSDTPSMTLSDFESNSVTASETVQGTLTKTEFTTDGDRTGSGPDMSVSLERTKGTRSDSGDPTYAISVTPSSDLPLPLPFSAAEIFAQRAMMGSVIVTALASFVLPFLDVTPEQSAVGLGYLSCPTHRIITSRPQPQFEINLWSLAPLKIDLSAGTLLAHIIFMITITAGHLLMIKLLLEPEPWNALYPRVSMTALGWFHFGSFLHSALLAFRSRETGYAVLGVFGLLLWSVGPMGVVWSYNKKFAVNGVYRHYGNFTRIALHGAWGYLPAREAFGAYASDYKPGYASHCYVPFGMSIVLGMAIACQPPAASCGTLTVMLAGGYVAYGVYYLLVAPRRGSLKNISMGVLFGLCGIGLALLASGVHDAGVVVLGLRSVLAIIFSLAQLGVWVAETYWLLPRLWPTELQDSAHMERLRGFLDEESEQQSQLLEELLEMAYKKASLEKGER